jgi:hypothetical protein
VIEELELQTAVMWAAAITAPASSSSENELSVPIVPNSADDRCSDRPNSADEVC